jgi:dihydropyrimidinase
VILGGRVMIESGVLVGDKGAGLHRARALSSLTASRKAAP